MPYLLGDPTHILILERFTMALPEAGSDGVADLDRSGDTYSGSRQPKRFDSRLNFWPWRCNMYK